MASINKVREEHKIDDAHLLNQWKLCLMIWIKQIVWIVYVDTRADSNEFQNYNTEYISFTVYVKINLKFCMKLCFTNIGNNLVFAPKFYKNIFQVSQENHSSPMPLVHFYVVSSSINQAITSQSNLKR